MRRFICACVFGSQILACSAFKPLDEKLISSDDKTRSAAIYKLSELSEEKQAALVEPLLRHLKDPESRVVNRVVDALSAIGRPAVDGLRTKLKDADPYVRLSAVSALGQMGPMASGSVPDLIQSLSDPYPLVREEAAFSLGQMGPLAHSAGPALLSSFNNANNDQKKTIVDALKKIGIKPPSFS